MNTNTMTNHDRLVSALKPYRGKTLTTSDIGHIVKYAFPEFNLGSLLPNDHAEGNKSPCSCAGTTGRIFDKVTRGSYTVR
jgi:hypothetical protein